MAPFSRTTTTAAESVPHQNQLGYNPGYLHPTWRAVFCAPVRTVCSRPLSLRSMLRASSASRGFSKMTPSQTTTVSAPMTMSAGVLCRARATLCGRVRQAQGGSRRGAFQRSSWRTVRRTLPVTSLVFLRAVSST